MFSKFNIGLIRLDCASGNEALLMLAENVCVVVGLDMSAKVPAKHRTLRVDASGGVVKW